MDVCSADDSGLIVPSAIPGIDVVPGAIAESGTSFTTAATGVRDHGATVVSNWAGIAAFYTAPESTELLDVMTPVGADTTALGDTLGQVGTILVDYAEVLVPIKKRLVDLQTEAQTFVDSVKNGVTVEMWDPDHPAFEAGIWSFLVTDFVDMGPKVIQWDKHQPSIDRNTELLTAVNVEVAKMDQAQVDAVNAIRLLRTDVCLVPDVAVTADELNAEGMVLPWGAATNGDRSCYESVNDGIEKNWNDMWAGAGMLIGYDSANDRWGGDVAGGAWLGAATMLGSLVLATSPFVWVGKFAPEGSVPQGFKDFSTTVWDNSAQVIEGLVGSPERWEKNPAEAAGGLGFNVLTFFIPGGAVVSGLKAGTLGARIAMLGGVVVDTVLPGLSTVIRAGGAAVLHGASALGEVATAARLGLTSSVGAARTALIQVLTGLGDRMPTIHIEAGSSVAVPDIGGGGIPRIVIGEPGSGGSWLHNAAEQLGGGGSPSALVPEAPVAPGTLAPDVPASPGSLDGAGRPDSPSVRPEETPVPQDIRDTPPLAGDTDGGNGVWTEKTYQVEQPWMALQAEKSGVDLVHNADGSVSWVEYIVNDGGRRMEFDGHVFRDPPGVWVFQEVKGNYDFMVRDFVNMDAESFAAIDRDTLSGPALGGYNEITKIIATAEIRADFIREVGGVQQIVITKTPGLATLIRELLVEAQLGQVEVIYSPVNVMK